MLNTQTDRLSSIHNDTKNILNILETTYFNIVFIFLIFFKIWHYITFDMYEISNLDDLKQEQMEQKLAYNHEIVKSFKSILRIAVHSNMKQQKKCNVEDA